MIIQVVANDKLVKKLGAFAEGHNISISSAAKFLLSEELNKKATNPPNR